ncbi:TPA: hypothetical protein DDW35_11900, partial [Candidatus Sumerlaeota bacterium]|nr:hypothetical protein [Candidatus Sumerlaeota bacterium]
VLCGPLERFGLVAFSYLAILFAYHYLLGPFYLYHLLGCVSVFGVFIAFALRSCPRKMLWVFAVFALFAGLMPGIPWALLGGKTSNPIAYHNPGMSTKLFYQLKYGQEPKMWEFINTHCLKSAILTHENRHLLFDPSIKLVHFDDWEVQQVWGKSKVERLARLRELGVKYYLFIPFEKDHPINARLGHAEWVQDGTLELIFQAGDAVLYRFRE